MAGAIQSISDKLVTHPDTMVLGQTIYTLTTVFQENKSTKANGFNSILDCLAYHFLIIV